LTIPRIRDKITTMTLDATLSPPLPPNKNRKPVPSPNQKPVVDQPSPLPVASRYEQAYKEVWGKMAKWKQLAIEDEKKSGTEGRFTDDFIKEVARLAEQCS